MKIGVDISQIVYGTGVSIYTKNLVENLLRIDRKNEYVFFFSSLRRRLNYSFINDLPAGKAGLTSSRVKFRKYRIPPTLSDFLWNRLHILPIERLIGQVDVFHTSDWTEPPTGCPKVTTIHDLTPLLFPAETHPKIIATHKRKLEWVKKETSLIIAVSESTKKDIVKILGIPEKKIRVIYEAAGEKFKPQMKEKVERVKRKYGISGDYILCFAGPPRKNTERVIKAIKGVTPVKELPLMIVGRPYVPTDDLPALYSGALCLVYPSLYEGFGLPILEAMACGCPVVTSNVSSMPEIAGDAAVLVNPKSVRSIAEGIKEAIKNREKLIKKGFKRVKLFSWRKTARETLEVYKSLIINH